MHITKLVRVLGLGIVLAGSLSGTAQRAAAMCVWDIQVIFYTDASKTEECGQRDICPGCNEGFQHWGCSTEYYDVYQIGEC